MASKSRWGSGWRRRQALLLGVGALALMSLSACGGGGSEASSGTAKQTTANKEVTRVTFETDYLPNGKYVPFEYGKAKGFFEAEGIDLDLEYGKGSGLTAQAVSGGKVDIGMIDSGVFALAVGKGQPLKSVGAYLGRNTFAFFVPEDSPVSNISELAGKQVITSPGTPESIVTPAVLRLVGLTPDAVNFKEISPSIADSTYAHGRGDAIGESVNFAKVFEKSRPSRALPWADAGYVLPGFSFVVSEKTLASEPDVIARFLKATYRSMTAALENPDEASAAYADANPTLPKDVVAASWGTLASYFCSQSAVDSGSMLGFQQPSDWTKGVATLKESADLPKSVDAQALYTNQFFDKDQVSTTKCQQSWG